MELLYEGVEGWIVREGVMGAGEPMSVGGLVVMDGVSMVWVRESVFEDGYCRLLLGEWVGGLRSMCSNGLFLLWSIIELIVSCD